MSWREALKENITTAEELSNFLHLSEEETKKLGQILERYPMSITRYYLSLINWEDINDPVRKMCIPSIQETDISGSFDTSGEAGNTVVEGMQHKYGETALILSTNRCAMYCRHCFRKRLVGLSDKEIAKHFEEMADYLKEHKEISNVLVSGGDAFLNDNDIIKRYLEVLSGIDHLDFIRFGTRTPVVLPERITGDPELIELLKEYSRKKQIFVVTHFNHPNELTPKAREAVRCLLEAGVPVRNQTVFLKGINDDPKVLGTLLKELTAAGVMPYYIFQCRPVTGVKNQFQVPFEKAYDIIEEAKNMQNGMGKSFRYVLSHEAGKIELLGRNEKGEMIFKFQQAKNPADDSRLFTKKLTADQCWLDEI